MRSEIPDAQTLHVAPSHLPSPPTHHYIAHSRDSNTLHWLKIPSTSCNYFKVWPRMSFKVKSLRRSILRCHFGFLWQSFTQIILAPILMLIILTPLCIQMFFSIKTESVDNSICYLVTAIALDWNNLTFSDTFGKFDRWEVFSGRLSWVWEDFSANKLNCTSSGEVQLTQA